MSRPDGYHRRPMSRITNREPPPEQTSADQSLARLLDGPFLARVVPLLAPEALQQLIQHRGLEGCGEVLTSATPAQLTALLDLDLWRHSQPGHDEQFDVDRFGEWLDALVDTGDSTAARIVAALDTGLVVAGLARYVRVFDPGIFEPVAQSDDEPTDRHEMMHSETSRDIVECDVGGYQVRARRTDAWDAIVTLLVTLAAEHHDCFHTVMQGCRRLSDSRPEIDSLDDLPTRPEQHLHDVASERAQRRSRRGYATPAEARAFLQMARQPARSSSSPAPTTTNPIARAYFRAAAGDEDDTCATVPGGAISAAIEAVDGVLAEAGVTPEPLRALLEAAGAAPRSDRLPLLRPLLEFLLCHDDAAYLARGRELAFLANTLLAGSSVQSRPFTPVEASEAAASVCNLGLAYWERGPVATGPPEGFLVDHDLVAVFEAGWSVLHRDVSLFVADQLLATLADLQCADADTGRGLRALQRELAMHREAGTPWLARDAAGVLARFDMTAWISVLGLLDECPILPATLTAILERRTTPVSPTAFQFIATTAQIDDVRAFMKALPGLLIS